MEDGNLLRKLLLIIVLFFSIKAKVVVAESIEYLGHYPNTGGGILGVFLVNVDTETSYNIDQNGHDLGQSIWVLVVEQ